MYVEREIKSECTTWSKKLDRNVRYGVRNKNEITTWSKKLDRNVRLGLRNYFEMYDLE